ncbi:SCO family protein [Sphingomonas nostoxanthinifaciens]|uniref:SCO family protein n=1 Tax=Sphingomonas nostoxanthinifaciens TaxID=2872652 RepID=UPI001CC1E4B2|nr:SCO family protein [Sphingomonas nostoxanthinifaciens]UAK24640.1 SCO family protein [Sphingomonas nostoxanthinifaciens]
MNKALPVLFAALVGLAACHRAPPAGTPPLAGAKLGGHFALTDQDGKPFDSARLLGHYPVVYFGYTFCPDVCPTEMQVLGRGLRAFERTDPVRAAKVLPVFITVDPARDTPAVLKAYVAAFHPRMIGLTGSDAAIAATAKQYAVFYQKAEPEKGASGYLMQHSTVAMLFGPDDKPIALVPVDTDAAQVAATFATWVK